MEGYIKLHRSIFEWEWWKDHNTMRLWIAILAMANWKPGSWRGLNVDRGQLVTSIAHLSEVTTLSRQSVRTSLNRLKSTGEITIKTTNKYSLITVVNYNKYQDDVDALNTQSNVPLNLCLTDNSHAANTQLTTIEERKKERMEENSYYSYSTEQPVKTLESLKSKYNSDNGRTAPDWMWEEMTQ